MFVSVGMVEVDTAAQRRFFLTLLRISQEHIEPVTQVVSGQLELYTISRKLLEASSRQRLNNSHLSPHVFCMDGHSTRGGSALAEPAGVEFPFPPTSVVSSQAPSL